MNLKSLLLENMLSMVLTVYEADQSCDPPTRNEVLLCNEKTDVEEVSTTNSDIAYLTFLP